MHILLSNLLVLYLGTTNIQNDAYKESNTLSANTITQEVVKLPTLMLLAFITRKMQTCPAKSDIHFTCDRV